MGSAQGKRVTPLTVVPGQTSFERALALRTPTLIATQVLVGLTILLFASWAHRGGAVSLAPETVLRAGAAFRPLVVAGEWWRLLAAPFLSDSLLLLAASVVALVVIGRTAERVFGTVAFLACFLVIGSGVALAGVLVSDTGLFVTLAPAVVGVGVAAWSVAVGLVASDRPSGTDGSTPALEFPEATVAGLFGTLALLVALTVFRAEDGILAQSLAVAMGLLLARAATADARFRKPAGRHVAAVALLAAAVLGIGLAYLSSKSDFRSEGFSLLATEERALDSFSKTLRRARWRGPAVAEELKPIVAQALRACASAQARADQMAARYQAEVVRNAKLDRYGRIANWREWVAARHQVDMGVAYKEYLRSREGVWQARLRFVSEGRLDTLKQMNVADAQARTALRQVLVRRESTGP